jgi:hypothetical protein
MTDVKLFDDSQWEKAPPPKAAYRSTIKVSWWEDDGWLVGVENFTLDDLAGRWYRTSMTGKAHLDVYTAREIVLAYFDALVAQTPPF